MTDTVAKTPTRPRGRPAGLTRIAVAVLSATAMFTIVSLLAIRADQAQLAGATGGTTAPGIPTTTLAPGQVVVSGSVPPTAGAAPTGAASGATVAAGGAPPSTNNGGNGAGGGPVAPQPVSGTPTAAPVAAPAAPTDAPAPAAPTAAPAPTTAAPAPTPPPNTNTGGS